MFAAQLSSDMLKHAGFGAWAATRAVPGLSRLLRGTAHLAKDVNLQSVSPSLYKNIRGAATQAAKWRKSGDQWAKFKGGNPATPRGGIARKALGTAGFVGPFALLGTPVVGPALMPIQTSLLNIGNAAGQASAASGGEGVQRVLEGGTGYVNNYYDELSNKSYGARRSMLNNPSDLSSSANAFAGGVAPETMSGGSAIWNAINPWGSGDISPYIRQRAEEKILK